MNRISVAALWLLLVQSLITVPATAQYQRLTSPNLASDAGFGEAIASDGNTLVIGASGTTIDGVQYAGAVHVYQKVENQWVLQATLVNPNPTGHLRFGSLVAVDDETIAVMANRVSSTQGQDAVYVYSHSGGVWNLSATLLPPVTQELAVTDLALDSNNLIVKGAVHDAGAALAYRWTGLVWSLVDTIRVVGHRIELEGDVLAIANTQEHLAPRGPNAGAVYVYRFDGSSWNREAMLAMDPPSENASFGSDMSISGDRLVAVGRDLRGLSEIHTFSYENGIWMKDHAVLVLPNRYAGTTTQVELEGDALLIGDPTASSPLYGDGSVSIFADHAGTWRLAHQIGNPLPDRTSSFGREILVGEEGVFVGATDENYGPSIYFAFAHITIEAPVLATPADSTHGLGTGGPLSLAWRRLPGARAYEVEIYRDGARIVAEQGLADTSFSFAGLEVDAGYDWRIRATSEAGTSLWSASRHFDTFVQKPAAPELVSPPDGYDDLSSRFATLTWRAAARATRYRVQVSRSANFATTELDTMVNNTLFVDFQIRERGDSYFWRASAVNWLGETNSKTWQFSTFPLTPATPVLIAPEAGATLVGGATALQWASSPGARTYEIQVASAPDFGSQVAFQTTAPDTLYLVSGLQHGRVHYWRVRAVNASGEGAWSPARSFVYAAGVSSESSPGLPKAFALRTGGPNPFRTTTRLLLDVDRLQHVRIEVFDVRGRTVALLHESVLPPGADHAFVWNAGEAPSGVYLVRATGEEEHLTQTLLLIR